MRPRCNCCGRQELEEICVTDAGSLSLPIVSIVVPFWGYLNGLNPKKRNYNGDCIIQLPWLATHRSFCSLAGAILPRVPQAINTRGLQKLQNSQKPSTTRYKKHKPNTPKLRTLRPRLNPTEHLEERVHCGSSVEHQLQP